VTVFMAPVACAGGPDVFMELKLRAHVHDSPGSKDESVCVLGTLAVDLGVCTGLSRGSAFGVL